MSIESKCVLSISPLLARKGPSLGTAAVRTAPCVARRYSTARQHGTLGTVQHGSAHCVRAVSWRRGVAGRRSHGREGVASGCWNSDAAKASASRTCSDEPRCSLREKLTATWAGRPASACRHEPPLSPLGAKSLTLLAVSLALYSRGGLLLATPDHSARRTQRALTKCPGYLLDAILST